ncbi:unnamed protein product [Tilletia controversa]|uniref:Arrestin-like N-terminal domain-containing protein n=2 Tax=Tilletia TaxID=13289 RepID=A0A8X7SX89_9BASI|nr:hypothetical protein CF336_g1398 [Tilletia laevis]KAE8202309.1 hypothetical protein CF328_g2290 [Tilletia controversa]KAE8264300.1 hypothetical protein A4X03_0g1045 [Tilletia caries]KAE8247731.1 hypothetical protein A4X06_0g4232 [Tilletia controversa]CAD6898291.1 unnamed protein product [Tilletia controversa]
MELFLTSDATTVILNSHGPTIFHAQVHLTIPRGTQPPSPRLDSIRVSLLCKESLSFPGGFIESSRWGSAVQVENVGQTVLRSGGTYTWEVQLKISDDMPAYERCRSGFCYQSLRAEATFGGFRLFRKTLEAEKSVFLVSPPESDDNFCYDHSQCGVGEGIGPILVQAQTQHLTVGGLLRTAAQIPAAAPDCELESVEFTLIQHTKLRSRKRPDRTAECGRKRVPLLKVDEKECEAMQWTFRLPNDMEMRPSTSCAGSSIQISHTMEARFYYSLDEEDDAGSEDSITSSSPSSLTGPVRRKKRAFLLSWPIAIPSCAFRWATIHLPPYSALDPSPVPVKSRDVWTGKNVHLSHDQCVCGQSMEEVLGVEEEMAQVHAIGAGMGKMDAGFDGSIFAGKDDRREKR